jgi:threonylcarbamoyladenosine tRNA methylthiotransferase MtaB
VTPKLYVEVAGCRLNACEAEEIQRRAVGLGASIAKCPEEADVSVLITCAVTSRSQARCRRAARSLLRRTSGRVVIGGCSARLFPDDFISEDLRLETACTALEVIGMILGGRPGSEEEVAFFEARSSRGTRTRALLKIQDGCDNRCSFCIVPGARGPSRSLDAERILSQAMELSVEGFREIVLTGIDIASWGSDLGGGADLPGLVRHLLDRVPVRIRLGSLEPMRLSRDFVRRLAVPGICRHLHVPFQSGSRAILEAMGRAGDPIEILGWLGEAFPGAGIGTDLIAGFPGESEEDFQRTVELSGNPRLSYFHVFPFCPRPGTAAAHMRADPGPAVIAQRAEALRRKSLDRKGQFRTSCLGTSATALVEGRSFDGSLVAVTDNYIPLRAPAGSTEGDEVRVTITRDNLLWGLR